MAVTKGKNMKTDSTIPYAVILLSQIVVDPNFNARHPSHLKATTGLGEGGEAGTSEGVASLSYSIEDDGQDTPVTVCANPDAKTAKDRPYFLVAGFRRVAALNMIAERALHNKVEHPIKADPTWSAKAPTVRAQVKNLSKAAAQLENLRENTVRDDLAGADLAFGVSRYLRTYALENDGKERGGPTEIARALGKHPTYIMKLLRIMKELPDTITIHWRASGKPLPVNSMNELTDEKKIKPEDREETYKKWCGAMSADDKKSEKKSDDESFEGICKSVGSSAKNLGRLHAMGHVDCADTAWMDRSLLRELGSVKKSIMGDDDKKWLALSKAANEAFKAGIAEVEENKAKRAAKLEAQKAQKDEKKADATPTN